MHAKKAHEDSRRQGMHGRSFISYQAHWQWLHTDAPGRLQGHRDNVLLAALATTQSECRYHGRDVTAEPNFSPRQKKQAGRPLRGRTAQPRQSRRETLRRAFPYSDVYPEACPAALLRSPCWCHAKHRFLFSAGWTGPNSPVLSGTSPCPESLEGGRTLFSDRSSCFLSWNSSPVSGLTSSSEF